MSDRDISVLCHWDEEKIILNDRSKSEINDLKQRIAYLQQSLDKALSDASAREEKFTNDVDAARLNAEERERRIAAADRQRLEADLAPRTGVRKHLEKSRVNQQL